MVELTGLVVPRSLPGAAESSTITSRLDADDGPLE